MAKEERFTSGLCKNCRHNEQSELQYRTRIGFCSGQLRDSADGHCAQVFDRSNPKDCSGRSVEPLNTFYVSEF